MRRTRSGLVPASLGGAGSGHRCSTTLWRLLGVVVVLLMATGVEGEEIVESATFVANRLPVVTLDCDPCIERSDTVVRVIVHGSQDDGFWQQVAVAIRQTAAALRITLQFELYDRVDFQQMASDIRAVAMEIEEPPETQRRRLPPDALVVTLPSATVEQAVVEVVATGLPVFGLNAGYDRAPALGLLAFVGMDEIRAGVAAAHQFRQLATVPLSRILFVNHAEGNVVLQQRLSGLTTTLLDPAAAAAAGFATSQPNATNATVFQTSTRVEEVWLDGPTDPKAESKLREVLRGCLYQGILVSSTILDVALEAKRLSSCGSASTPILVGVMDTNTRVYQAINLRQVDFAISQQQWLQGALSTLLASTYASTGMTLQQLASETEHGTYLSGPQIIDVSNTPTDTLRQCETEGFPICSEEEEHRYQGNQQQQQNDNEAVIVTMSRDSGVVVTAKTESSTATSSSSVREALGKGDCPCFDRRQLQFAAVVHGLEIDPFWWPIQEAAFQAAKDMNVAIDFELQPPEDDATVLLRRMAGKILSFCLEGVDGLMVSIPDHHMLEESLITCRQLNIPIISINAGAESSRALGLLQHVEQDEYRAGFIAGQQLVAAGAQRGIFLAHDPDFSHSIQRSQGLHDAFVQAHGTSAYLGLVSVPADNSDETVRVAETAVRTAGFSEWEKLGVMVSGTVLVPPLLALLDRRPGVLGATFGTDSVIVKLITKGELEFGIDPNQYLQGYLPVVLLTWFTQTNQSLANTIISSRPRLVFSTPSDEQEQCKDNNFAVCPPPVALELNQLGPIRALGQSFATIVFLTAAFFAFWVFRRRKTAVIQHAQPAFLLMVCFGAALMGSTILALGVDDEVAPLDRVNVSCMIAPWLFTIGFSITFAALFSKLMRLNRLIEKATRFRRVRVKPKDVMMPFVILITLNVAFLTTWTVVDPMFWSRNQLSETTSYGSCRLGSTKVSKWMAGAVASVNLVALVIALFEAYKSRKVSYEFSESGSIAIVVASILQVALVGGPIIPLVQTDPPTSFLLKSGLVFAGSMSTLLIIFVPKLRTKNSHLASSTASVAQLLQPRTTVHSGMTAYSGHELSATVLIRQLKYRVRRGEVSQSAILEAFERTDTAASDTDSHLPMPSLVHREHSKVSSAPTDQIYKHGKDDMSFAEDGHDVETDLLESPRPVKHLVIENGRGADTSSSKTSNGSDSEAHNRETFETQPLPAQDSLGSKFRFNKLLRKSPSGSEHSSGPSSHEIEFEEMAYPPYYHPHGLNKSFAGFETIPPPKFVAKKSSSLQHLEHSIEGGAATRVGRLDPMEHDTMGRETWTNNPSWVIPGGDDLDSEADGPGSTSTVLVSMVKELADFIITTETDFATVESLLENHGVFPQEQKRDVPSPHAIQASNTEPSYDREADSAPDKKTT